MRLLIIFIIILTKNFLYGQLHVLTKVDSLIIDTTGLNSIPFNFIVIREPSCYDSRVKTDTIYSFCDIKTKNIIIEKFRNEHGFINKQNVDGIYISEYDSIFRKKTEIIYFENHGEYNRQCKTYHYYDNYDSIIRSEAFVYSTVDKRHWHLSDFHLVVVDYSDNYLIKEKKVYNSNGNLIAKGYTKFNKNSKNFKKVELQYQNPFSQIISNQDSLFSKDVSYYYYKTDTLEIIDSSYFSSNINISKSIYTYKNKNILTKTRNYKSQKINKTLNDKYIQTLVYEYDDKNRPVKVIEIYKYSNSTDKTNYYYKYY